MRVRIAGTEGEQVPIGAIGRISSKAASNAGSGPGRIARRSAISTPIAFAIGLVVLAGAGCKRYEVRSDGTPTRALCLQVAPVVDEREPAPVADAKDATRAIVVRPQAPEDDVAALYDLAGAVRSLRDAPDRSGWRIQAITDRIAATPTDAPRRTRLIKDALFEAEQALEASHSQHTDIPCYGTRVTAARRAVRAIDEPTPVDEQREVIDRAFRAVAEAFPAGTAIQPVAGGAAEASKEAGRRVPRFLFDNIGRTPEATDRCGDMPSIYVYDRTAGDIAISIATFGIYTPAHARAVCATTQ